MNTYNLVVIGSKCGSTICEV